VEPGGPSQIEQATPFSRLEPFRLRTGVLFIVAMLVFAGTAFGGVPDGHLIVAAAMIGGYMAMNIGASDAGESS
jgi:PiT family inorganic phosphate transporter